MTVEGEQYVKYREHVAARDELKAKLQELELQNARLSASLMHLPEKVDALIAEVNALVRRVPVPQEHVQSQLGLHHLADEIRSIRETKGGGSIERWLLLAMIGGAGWMAARFFIGG